MRNTLGLDQSVAALDKDSKRWGFGELVRNIRGNVDKRVPGKRVQTGSPRKWLAA